MARGSIVKRGKNSYAVVLHLGYFTDPETGKRKRKQKWVAVKGLRRDAEARLAELLTQLHSGSFPEPHKLTLGEWLDYWLESRIKGQKTRNTVRTFSDVIKLHLKPSLGDIRLQQLSFRHIEKYYREKRKTLAARTVRLHHTVLVNALKRAERKKLITNQIMHLVDNVPALPSASAESRKYWTAEQAVKAIKAAGDIDPQVQTFVALALDTGARRCELLGLRWKNVDLDGGKIAMVEQLVKGGKEPELGPPKGAKARTVEISPATVEMLKRHRSRQAELKMANRKHYRDLGFVFAVDWHQMRGGYHIELGQPLPICIATNRWLPEVAKRAGVPAISTHGLRHSCATMLLQANIPIKVVSERLGHATVTLTMDIYQHCLPTMQAQAATALSSMLYGTNG